MVCEKKNLFSRAYLYFSLSLSRSLVVSANESRLDSFNLSEWTHLLPVKVFVVVASSDQIWSDKIGLDWIELDLAGLDSDRKRYYCVVSYQIKTNSASAQLGSHANSIKIQSAYPSQQHLSHSIRCSLLNIFLIQTTAAAAHFGPYRWDSSLRPRSIGY